VLSSSKNDSKQDARFVARLDVLLERVDTLASTVATTASAIAKKDGEIASLRRDLEARDQTLQALVARAQAAQPAGAGGPVADSNELRSLRNAVAALTKEHAEDRGTAHVEALVASVRSLGQRVDELSASAQAAATAPATDPETASRIGALEAQLASVRSFLEQRASEPDRPSDELLAMLATLRSQVEALSGLTAGVTEEQLDDRFAEMDGARQKLSQRIDALAESVESATTSLGSKEQELAALHSHFTESSTRIESIVGDIRETLHAFPELSSTSLDALAARVERIEESTREATDARERGRVELARRVDDIEQRVTTVAEEVARAKTLWPVALRSLEARLDDAVHAGRPDADEGDAKRAGSADEPSEDLLAGLRDSLQAMESVAAEMARASETLSGSVDEPPTSEPPEAPEHEEAPEQEETAEPEPEAHASAAVAGATIVPLRASEP
jgi:DNA repair exonuclease SbcCD ATPase subunit